MRHMLRRLIVVLVLVVVFAAGRWTTQAQVPVPSPAPRGQAQAPTVISGADIGFRVDRHKGSTPVGVLVVRVDGQWVEPEFAVVARPATVR